MSSTKPLAALAAIAMAMAALTACSGEKEPETTPPAAEEPAAEEPPAEEPPAAEAGLVGVTMPTKSLERWNNDGAHLTEQLGALGYETQLDYADNKVEQQISQLENQINSGAKALVVASIDGESLGTVLATAKTQGIPIIAYDRLLMNTDAVDYYATFDNFKVGVLQGEFIRDTLGLDTEAGPFNLEMFAGDPGDNNAGFFFKGAWSILQPYVESGKLVVPSDKIPSSEDDWPSIGIANWNTQTAQAEMDNRLNSFYTADKIDVVLSPNDSLALGIAQSLESAGYKVGDDWPILTGQDADEANTKNIIAGKQSMTVWKDTRQLGDRVAIMIQSLFNGEAVETNDETTYNNGIKNVPTYLLDPEVVTKDQIQDRLVGTGFYTAEQLGL
jgi:putative multiple sugar transport system substrate-binding protein